MDIKYGQQMIAAIIDGLPEEPTLIQWARENQLLSERCPHLSDAIDDMDLVRIAEYIDEGDECALGKYIAKLFMDAYQDDMYARKYE